MIQNTCRERLTVDDTGQYRCRVSDKKGGAVISEPATVALAHSQETDSTGPRSPQQIQQLKGTYSHTVSFGSSLPPLCVHLPTVIVSCSKCNDHAS